MKNKILICAASLFLTSCNPFKEMREQIESAYFKGQKDALNGDVRIRKNRDSCWIWVKSPWDSGGPPCFNPSVICN